MLQSIQTCPSRIPCVVPVHLYILYISLSHPLSGLSRASFCAPWMALMRTAFICRAVVDAACLEAKKHESNHKNKPHCPHSKAETSPILMLFVVFSWFSCMFVIVCVCVLFLSCGLKIQPHSPAALSRNRACWKAPVMVQQSVPQFCSSVPIPCLLQTHLDTDLP